MTERGSTDTVDLEASGHLSLRVRATCIGGSEPVPAREATAILRARLLLDTRAVSGLPLRLFDGPAFEHYKEEGSRIPIAVNEWQPRVAVRIRPTAELEFRAAYTETLTRRNIFSDTLDRTTRRASGSSSTKPRA